MVENGPGTLLKDGGTEIGWGTGGDFDYYQGLTFWGITKGVTSFRRCTKVPGTTRPWTAEDVRGMTTVSKPKTGVYRAQ